MVLGLSKMYLNALRLNSRKKKGYPFWLMDASLVNEMNTTDRMGMMKTADSRMKKVFSRMLTIRSWRLLVIICLLLSPESVQRVVGIDLLHNLVCEEYQNKADYRFQKACRRAHADVAALDQGAVYIGF